ncbi:hypothetical protein COO60DRAFT_1021537 [Scenedesmus sp. NREL 46B-D3]|nr:hypothetical protein COO60DRAFT_1021537 [Scenedesmus sp. NREL 46B-D3]
MALAPRVLRVLCACSSAPLPTAVVRPRPALGGAPGCCCAAVPAPWALQGLRHNRLPAVRQVRRAAPVGAESSCSGHAVGSRATAQGSIQGVLIRPMCPAAWSAGSLHSAHRLVGIIDLPGWKQHRRGALCPVVV